MLEALKFRNRISLLVALASFALIAVTGTSLILGRRGVEHVSGIENRYVPLLELNRELMATFGSIARALEDAASAAEENMLREADAMRDRFLTALASGQHAIAQNGAEPLALRREFLAYYELARAVTGQIVAGQAGEDLLEKAQAMSAAQRQFASHLDTGTTPHRARLAASFESARAAYGLGVLVDVAIAGVAFVLMLLLSWWIIRGTAQSLQAVSEGVERLARGDFSQEIRVVSRDEFGALAREANRTAVRLREYRERAAEEDWVKTGTGGLASEIAGDLRAADLGRRAVTYLARYVGAPMAVAYATDEQGSLNLLEAYAHGASPTAPKSFQPGEGIIGQTARDGEVHLLSDLPEDYASIRSGLGETRPRHILAVPFNHEGRCMGVLEFGLLDPPVPPALELMRRTRDALGVAFKVAESRQRVQALVDQMQTQAEELRRAYDSLQAQNSALQVSEHALHVQQEELRSANDELERQADALDSQRIDLVVKNDELEEAKLLIEQKASELARASKYKSDFLANMSHELRTPLNSIMILAKIMATNEDGLLGPKHLEFAHVIHKSGEELLTLINDVLDLAKVEAGKQDLHYGSVALREVASYMRQMFEPFALQKGVDFEVEMAEGLPDQIQTDLTRLEQILKNLLSNALKFTERGRIAVRIFHPAIGDGQGEDQSVIAIAVADTGVGIPVQKQEAIFEAFSQADGGTSRKYGGTGLGLAIARQLAIRLGGELCLQSQVGLGSTFVLHLPIEEPRRRPPTSAPPILARLASAPRAIAVADDRRALTPGDACLLVIEDDVEFAGILVDLIRQAGRRALVATTGGEGMMLARRFTPSGIILDVRLPDMDGWAVMTALKADRGTGGIPVHFLSGSGDAERASAVGAAGFLSKPVDPEQIRTVLRTLERAAAAPPKVLVVEGDAGKRETLCGLLSGLGAAIESAGTEQEAMDRLDASSFGVVVLDTALPDNQTGLAVLARMRGDPRTSSIPVIVHTGVALTAEEEPQPAHGTQTIVIPEGERSVERVLEETRRLVRRIRSEPIPPVGGAIEVADGSKALLDGKRVLIVDDDMRNVYSLTRALQSARLEIFAAADGFEALEQLEEHADTDIVLMDIMMPRMDGHEAIRRIRGHPRFHEMPIIALTARTMPGEREKCLGVGANDYIPKPVDIDNLLSVLRVWLPADR